MAAKKTPVLGKDQKQVKFLKVGDIVRINQHEYYYKGKQNVMPKGFKTVQVAFWSTKTSLKKYFNLDLMEHVVSLNSDGVSYRWEEKE